MRQRGSHTLLVVDDDEGNRDMLSRRLQREGFTVLCAESGQQALELVARQAIDLVLLDVMMPGLSGLDVLRQWRSQPPTAELPVIMVTARTQSEDVVEALELGADDYVTKPLDFPVVLARIALQLRQRKSTAPAAAATSPVGPGTLLAGRYRLEQKLGAGTYGTVYRALHLDIEKLVAVKVLQSSFDGQGEAVARFRREGVAACRIKHPNAVAILDFGVTPEGAAFLVMELLEGLSLDEEIKNSGRTSAGRAAFVMAGVCEALAAAHGAGIVHRDVKPANIFLHRGARGEEIPKVLDFGIAKLLDENATANQATREGYILGTPAYMAPERFRPRASYDGRADVYSVGVVLYQMLVGRLPFRPAPDDPMSVVAQHLNARPEPPRQLAPGVPRDLDLLVLRCLEKHPEARPTAAELARELVVMADTESLFHGVLAPGVIADTAAGDPQREGPVVDPRPAVTLSTDPEEQVGTIEVSRPRRPAAGERTLPMVKPNPR